MKKPKIKKTFIYVIADALRHDYINEVDTPFLYTQSQAGIYVKKIKSSAGFTQRSALFCGANPKTSGNFTMYAHGEGNSPFAFTRKYRYLLKLWHNIFDFFEKFAYFIKNKNEKIGKMLFQIHSGFNNLLKSRLQNIANKNAFNAPIGNIPFHLLYLLKLPEDQKIIHKKNGLSVESIFDVMIEQKIKYKYLMYPVVNGDDESTQVNLLSNLKKNYQAYFIQFSDSDGKVHECGPDDGGINKRKAIIGEIDRKLREIFYHANKFFDDVTILVVGDHGMTNVKKTIDMGAILRKEAKKFSIKESIDYFFILDSTMVRLFSLTKKGEKFLSTLNTNSIFLNNGQFIDSKIINKYKLPEDLSSYGNLIWWANNGVMIFPDYFQNRNKLYKGMHGYRDHNDSKGTLVVFGNNISRFYKSSANLIDICPLFCNLMKLPIPKFNDGKKILKNYF